MSLCQLNELFMVYAHPNQHHTIRSVVRGNESFNIPWGDLLIASSFSFISIVSTVVYQHPGQPQSVVSVSSLREVDEMTGTKTEHAHTIKLVNGIL